MIETEEDWETCTDVRDLLLYLMQRDRITARQARLFACACCRDIWQMLTDERSRHAVEVAERYADGVANDSELLAAFEGALDARRSQLGMGGKEPAFSAAAACAATEHEFTEDLYTPQDIFCYAERPLQLALAAAYDAAERSQYARCDAEVGPPAHPEGRYSKKQSRALDAHRTKVQTSQCQLLRDIVGNPFRPVVIDSAWLTRDDGLIRRLAQVIYDDRAHEHYPMLGDALEEAGCTDVSILDHCRHPTQHARGCRLIDRLLGLEQEPQADPAFVTQAERTWLMAENPRRMLEALLDRQTLLDRPVNKRQLRRFMVACCRALEQFLSDERLRQAVDVAERFANGSASAQELQQTSEAVYPPEELIWNDLFRYHVAAMVSAATAPDPDEGDLRSNSVWDLIQHAEDAVGIHACEPDAAFRPEEAIERVFAGQADLLRDIFGNPFRPTATDPR